MRGSELISLLLQEYVAENKVIIEYGLLLEIEHDITTMEDSL